MNIRQKLQDITREQYVHEYRNLPESFMCHRHGLYFDGCNKNEAKFVNKTRETYRHTALWLELYLLDRTECLFEANLKPKCYFKPFAELQMDYLKLIQEVHAHPQSADAKINYPSPLSWLFLIQIESCEIALQNSGYLGGEPIDIGKCEAYEVVKGACNELEDVDIFPSTTSLVKVTPLRHLVQIAMYISQKDRAFKNNYWYPFLKSRKRFFRKIKESPLCIAVISEGETVIKTNGSRGKGKKKRKVLGEL